jgi:hypothetical protein
MKIELAVQLAKSKKGGEKQTATLAFRNATTEKPSLLFTGKSHFISNQGHS